MAKSVPYLRKSATGIWYVHWTEDRVGKRVSTRTASLDAAKVFLAQWLLMESQPSDDVGAQLTIIDIWSVYFEKHVKRKAGVAAAEFAWKNLEPHFGALTVAQVTQDAIDRYVAKRTAGRIGRPSKPQTCRRELAYLVACVHFAASPKQKLIPAALVPVFGEKGVELPADGAPRERVLTDAEIAALHGAAARLARDSARLTRLQRFLWLALETAGREAALLDLTWDRVDFDTNVIHLAVPGRRATKKRRASVPISTALRPILLRAYEERIGDRVLDAPSKMWASVQTCVVAAGLVPAREPVKTSEKPKRTGVSPNTFRHTAATNMARRGVPLWKVAKILGNTLVMVERVYAKHTPEDLREAVEHLSPRVLEAA
jgi:integrase